MIPDLSEAYSVLIQDKWIEIRNAEPSELSGWTVLELTSDYLRVNVRTDAITAVRYRTLPGQALQAINSYSL